LNDIEIKKKILSIARSFIDRYGEVMQMSFDIYLQKNKIQENKEEIQKAYYAGAQMALSVASSIKVIDEEKQ
jgi:hypothetical protein